MQVIEKLKKFLIVLVLLAPLTVTSAPGEYTNTVTKFVWTPPTEDVSGDLLVGVKALQGFKMYCGTASGAYNMETPYIIQDGNATSVLISEVLQQDGNYFCALTAFNNAGESELSNEIAVKLSAGVATRPDQVLPAAPAQLRLE